MFIKNKYYVWYFNIINNAKAQNRTRNIKLFYYEAHHIIPKSLNGTNDRDNIVLLTAKEHFVCHHLLVKMMSDKIGKIKMTHAFWRMMHAPQHMQKLTSKVYARIREERALSISENSKGEKNHFYGKKHNDRTKAIMRRKAKGRNPHDNYKGKSYQAWNKGLNKENNKSVNSISQKRMGINNPMYGRKGIDHPNAITLTLFDNDKKEIAIFFSRKEFSDYCRKHNIPFRGLYLTMKNDSVYKDTSRNKKFGSYTGWSVRNI